MLTQDAYSEAFVTVHLSDIPLFCFLFFVYEVFESSSVSGHSRRVSWARSCMDIFLIPT